MTFLVELLSGRFKSANGILNQNLDETKALIKQHSPACSAICSTTGVVNIVCFMSRYRPCFSRQDLDETKALIKQHSPACSAICSTTGVVNIVCFMSSYRPCFSR
ncbi:hypothetical protein RRG08_015137 [Elysia crispata]|uniref:Uncharacterized protein n=1 Tax=Elysia crispata TaxID=231223 RepID=A0AAE0ZVW2_9GAST|nr:hypothetical protein RRG08_015137 [Elysia crispata]